MNRIEVLLHTTWVCHTWVWIGRHYTPGFNFVRMYGFRNENMTKMLQYDDDLSTSIRKRPWSYFKFRAGNPKSCFRLCPTNAWPSRRERVVDPKKLSRSAGILLWNRGLRMLGIRDKNELQKGAQLQITYVILDAKSCALETLLQKNLIDIFPNLDSQYLGNWFDRSTQGSVQSSHAVTWLKLPATKAFNFAFPAIDRRRNFDSALLENCWSTQSDSSLSMHTAEAAITLPILLFRPAAEVLNHTLAFPRKWQSW